MFAEELDRRRLRFPLDEHTPGDEGAEARACSTLAAGGILLLPTDTLYGLSCRFTDLAARERVRLLKGPDRPASFIALVADLAMALRFAESPEGASLAYLRERWPGPLTVILRARPELDEAMVGPDRSVAFRWPALPALTALVREMGEPLVSTSANVHGEAPATTVDEAWAAFGTGIDLYLDAGPRAGAASALVDLRGPEIRILRLGPSA